MSQKLRALSSPKNGCIRPIWCIPNPSCWFKAFAELYICASSRSYITVPIQKQNPIPSPAGSVQGLHGQPVQIPFPLLLRRRRGVLLLRQRSVGGSVLQRSIICIKRSEAFWMTLRKSWFWLWAKINLLTAGLHAPLTRREGSCCWESSQLAPF